MHATVSPAQSPLLTNAAHRKAALRVLSRVSLLQIFGCNQGGLVECGESAFHALHVEVQSAGLRMDIPGILVCLVAHDHLIKPRPRKVPSLQDMRYHDCIHVPLPVEASLAAVDFRELIRPVRWIGSVNTAAHPLIPAFRSHAHHNAKALCPRGRGTQGFEEDLSALKLHQATARGHRLHCRDLVVHQNNLEAWQHRPGSCSQSNPPSECSVCGRLVVYDLIDTSTNYGQTGERGMIRRLYGIRVYASGGCV
jgi:hypothetical protein